MAAYNAGETNVNRWVAEAGGEDDFDPSDDIPFAETRAYVENVSSARRSTARTTGPTSFGL